METLVVYAEPIENFVKLPSLISAFSCGFGNPYDDGYEFHDVPESVAKKAKDGYVIEATGKSMEPVITEGDKLLIDHDLQPQKGDIIVAHLNGDFLIKTYKPVNGQTILLSQNMDYDPIVVNPEDNFQVLGVVIYNLKKINGRS